MKKLNIIIMMMIVVGVLGVNAEVPESSQITVTLMSQDPDPVRPGDMVEVRFKVENLGGKSVRNVEFELMPEYPFSLPAGEPKVRMIGGLQGWQTGDDNVIVHYKVLIDKDAPEGDRELKVKYKVDGIWYKEDEFDIRVQSVDAAISVVSLSSEPDIIHPGEKALVKVKLKNLADSVMEDISFKLDLALSSLLSKVSTSTVSNGDATTIYYDSVPFAPINGATEQKIKFLKPGEEKELVFEIIAYPNAESRVYKIPIVLEYRDELERNYTKEDIVGLVVGSKPQIQVILESTEITQADTVGTITLKIVNHGVNDIKFVNLEVGENGAYRLLSSARDYIGNIDSDDYETADIKLYMKPGDAAEVKIPVKLSYMDTNNKEYYAEYEVVHNLYTNDEALKFGFAQQSNTMSLLVLVVLVILGVWYYRRRKKQKLLEKKK